MAATLRKVTVGTSSTTVVPASTVIATGSRNVRFVNRSQVPITLGNGDILAAGGEKTLSLAYTSTFTCTAPVSTSLEVYDDYPIVGPQVVAAAATDVDREVWVSGEAYPRARWLADGAVLRSDGVASLNDWDSPSELISSGECAFNRRWCNSASGLTMTSQTLRGARFRARRSEPIVKIGYASGGTAAGATPSLVTVGVYELDSANTGTLVAQSTEDGTANLAATNTYYTSNLSATWNKVAGRDYLVCLLVVTAAAAPTVLSSSPTNAGTAAIGTIMTLEPVGNLQKASQATLPSTLSSAVPSSSGAPFMVCLNV